MNSNSLWDDSQCTVDEKYNLQTCIKPLNQTCQFRNVLRNNRRNGSQAWAFEHKILATEVKDCKAPGLDLKDGIFEWEDADSLENSAFKVEIYQRFTRHKSHHVKQVTKLGIQDRNWNSIWRQKQLLSSSKILSGIQTSEL